MFLHFPNLQDKSFSSETGGGGPQSNMNLVPYLLHMALYVLNTTRSAPRESTAFQTFLEQPVDKWLGSCYAHDGPLYWCVMAMLVASPKRWRSVRVKMLQRLLLLAHVRSVSVQCADMPSGQNQRNFELYMYLQDCNHS